MKTSKLAPLCIIFTLIINIFAFSVVLAEDPIIVANNPIEIITSQAWYDADSLISGSYLPAGINNDAQLVQECSNILKNKFSNVTYTKSFIRNELDLGSNTFDFEDFFDSLGTNQIIIWQGHGTWNGENDHSVLWTGRAYDENKLETNEDYQDGSIVNAQGNEAISYKYILKHASNLDNSLIYLGQCESGYDPVLAQAFLAKGASAVVVNTKIINASYSDMMQYTVIKLLGDNYTLSQALNEAKTDYGQDDSEFFHGIGGEPIIYGNENYCISSIKYKLNLNYDGTSQAPFDNLDGFDLLDGGEYTSSATQPGTYKTKAILKPGYIWPDGTITDKEIVWTISKKQTTINDFILPTIPDIAYDGNTHNLLNLSSLNSKYYFALQDEDGNVGTYSNTIPVLTDAGYYNVNWYYVGDDISNGYGSQNNPIVYPVIIKFAEFKNEKVVMNDYEYGKTIAIPKMTNGLDLDNKNTITYYYDTKDSNMGGKIWKNMDSATLDVGTYYIYGIIKRDNYLDYVSPTTKFKVYTNSSEKKEYTIPKTGTD